MKKFLIIISTFISYLAHAQDYVVTHRNDTLRGVVKILTYDVIDRIQVVDGKKRNLFTAIQVKSVRIGSNSYQPVRSSEGYRMMKLVKAGYLSLYLGHLPNNLNYDTEYLVKKDGSTIEVPNLGFKRTMTNFLKDCAAMEEKIESGQLGRKNLDQLITEYNSCIDDQTKAVNGPSAVSAEDPRLVALMTLKTKLANSTLPAKNDAMDILNDITGKVKSGQAVPNYLLEGLKGMLKNDPDFQPDLEKAIALLTAK